MKISCVIPCYNSAQIVGVTVSRIVTALKIRDTQYQIILVNDGSEDNTYAAIEKLCAEDKNIVGINLARNFGQQSARAAALHYITGDYVVFTDDDGQHPAEGIYQMIDKLEEGYDLVYAKFREKKHTCFQKFGSYVNAKMTVWLVGKPKEVTVSSFFVMRAFVAHKLAEYTSPFSYLLGYIMQITRNIANVDMVHQSRIDGRSGYTFRKMFSLWLNGFTSFSVVPLRAASLLGTLVASAGFFAGVGVIIRKLINPAIEAGYTSLVAVILFIGGILMLMLGLLGEYVGRIFMTVNTLPQYVIRDSVNLPQKESK